VDQLKPLAVGAAAGFALCTVVTDVPGAAVAFTLVGRCRLTLSNSS